MKLLVVILIYTSVLAVFLICAKVFSIYSKPVIHDTIHQNNIKTIELYLTNVFCYEQNCPSSPYGPYGPTGHFPFLKYNEYSMAEHSEKDINILNTFEYFNFLYDNAPNAVLKEYKLAENLSFSWPPKYGTRYKLTAFPYPKSNNIFEAVYQIISNTIDAYTFPGWMIQRRNPFDFNNSIYSNNYFRDFQDIEVLHACYPPPGAKYPFCDDGGWWLYLATGSGVFWNTGKCFVSLNKISLLNDLYNCSQKARRLVQEYNELQPAKGGKIKPVPPVVGLSIADMADRLKGKGGGYSITVAIFATVNSLTKHEIPKGMIGFKNMTPSSAGGPAWENFITQTTLVFYLMIVIIIQLFQNTIRKPIKHILIISIICLILIVSLILFFIFGITETFLRKIGWITLDMALKETGMNLYEFVEECATGKLNNPICNSLAMIQFFDLEIEADTFALGYDSFILTTQPNKTGTWEVEICDLRSYNPKTAGIAVNAGICGGYLGNKNEYDNTSLKERVDICHNKIYPKSAPELTGRVLKTGPLVYDSSGPPYYGPSKLKPQEACQCVESKKSMCTSCKGFLSEKMCN